MILNERPCLLIESIIGCPSIFLLNTKGPSAKGLKNKFLSEL